MRLDAPWTDEEYAEIRGAPNWQVGIAEVQNRRLEQSGGRTMRHFDSGAIRDSDADKLDFEGYLSPNVLMEFARYMHRHGQTAEGQRASDNWQNGFGEDVVMKSLLRHVMDLWMLHRGYSQERFETGDPVKWADALGGAMFNIMALWHERLQAGEEA